MPAPASGPSPSSTSPSSTAAPPRVAVRTGWRAHTVLGWGHADDAQGPDALTFRRTGGRSSLFCPRREAELGQVVRTAQRTAATPPIGGANPAPRWTLRRLVGWA